MSVYTHKILWEEADYYASQMEVGRTLADLSKESKTRACSTISSMAKAARVFPKEYRKPILPSWWLYPELALISPEEKARKMLKFVRERKLSRTKVRKLLACLANNKGYWNNIPEAYEIMHETKSKPKTTPKHTPIVADLNVLSGNRWKFAETLKKYKDDGMCAQALATLMNCSYQTVINWLRVVETFPPEYRFSNIPPSYYITLMRADDPLQAAKYASENNLTLAEIRELIKEGIPAKATAALPKTRLTELIDPDAVMQLQYELETIREVAQNLWVENAALKKELHIAKNLCDTYLKELQRKTDLLKQVG